MVAFSLFEGIGFFVDIAHWVLDHLLWNHVYHVLEGFFQSIDNQRLLFAQVNYGIRSEELREVGWDYIHVYGSHLTLALQLMNSSETVH